MAVSVKKREGENSSAVVYRFTRKVQRSGVLREFRKRRFHGRRVNRSKRRRSALHRDQRKAEIEQAKKLGTFWK